MKVRGTSILTRKAIITRTFGGEAWSRLFADFARTHPSFGAPLTAASLLSLREFLEFHDELVRRFFGEGADSHAQLGQLSARWALTDGPHKSLLEQKNIGDLAASFPGLWRAYFAETDSWAEAALTDSGVELRAYGLPVRHPYFDDFLVAYMKEALELFCANPIRVIRPSDFRDHYHYFLTMSPASEVLSTIGEPDRGDARRSMRAPSDREIAVLRLVGNGKTNKEIGLSLGISAKTVQHHIARAYDKLGISSRAGVAVWLAQNGLLAR